MIKFFNRKTLITAAVFCVTLLWFQNCGQVSKDNMLTDENNVFEGSRAIDTENLKMLEHQFTTTEAQDRGGGRIVEVPVQNELLIDLVQGTYSFKNSSDKFCLSEEDKSELNQILSGANICEKRAESGQVCTMEYALPYAVLKFDNDEIRLGEKTSGCESLDLCEAYPAVLKGYLADLKNNSASRVCH